MELDRQGRSPLHYAALTGDLSEVERLLSSGIDPNLGDGNGFTPLHLAAQEYQVDAARLLLDGGAAADRRNRFENTPLFVAVFNSQGRGELIGLLRSRGADPHAENSSGQTPVGLARMIANHDVRSFFSDLD
ncbi:ankyrin repeat domain-containing protein [Streptomyces sp. NPDC048696]|uniref:ankyrin repeat domain-containing protein n=1 Tax=Streptomyces sp. NPDC048696 TaxID=3365585 RepID=UPI0037223A63